MPKKEEGEKRSGMGFGLGFGELFKGIASIIDLAVNMAEMADLSDLDVEKHVEFRTLSEARGADRPRGVYGVSVGRGRGGIPRVQPFGNIRRTERGPVIDEVREPLVDIFEEDEVVSVIAELPGVEEKDVQTEVEGGTLKLSTTTKGRRYAKEIELPCAVDEGKMESTYNNGVLEIKLTKAIEEGEGDATKRP